MFLEFWKLHTASYVSEWKVFDWCEEEVGIKYKWSAFFIRYTMAAAVRVACAVLNRYLSSVLMHIYVYAGGADTGDSE